MTQELEDRLAAAVELLTEARDDAVTAYDDEGRIAGIHSITHDALIQMLIDGPSMTGGGRSAETKIPIDMEALRILAGINQTLTGWRTYTYYEAIRGDTIGNLNRWHQAHAELVRNNHATEQLEHEAVTACETWVRQINDKYAGRKYRDLTDPCPNCNTRRVLIDDDEQDAVRIYVAEEYAECRYCGTQWIGLHGTEEQPGLVELRWLLNIADERRKHDTPENEVMQSATEHG